MPNNIKQALDEIKNFAKSLEEGVNFKGDIVKSVKETLRPDETKLASNKNEALHDAIFQGTKKEDKNLVKAAKNNLPKEELSKVEDEQVKRFVSEFIDNVIKGFK